MLGDILFYTLSEAYWFCCTMPSLDFLCIFFGRKALSSGEQKMKRQIFFGMASLKKGLFLQFPSAGNEKFHLKTPAPTPHIQKHPSFLQSSGLPEDNGKIWKNHMKTMGLFGKFCNCLLSGG